MPALVTRVIATAPLFQPVTEWLDASRQWTRDRSLAHEFPTRGDAEEVAEEIRAQRSSPFFVFAKPAQRFPEPELALAGELTPDTREQRERVEAAALRRAAQAPVRPPAPVPARRDWHQGKPNCGVE